VPIKFSDHAKRQLRTRKIPQHVVIQAVGSPQKISSSFRHRKLRQMRFDDKILEVITKTEGSIIIVITAYFLEE
jgi:hypothetical protein